MAGSGNQTVTSETSPWAPPVVRSSSRLARHAESWLAIDRLGTAERPFLPTYEGVPQPVDGFHRFLASCPTDGLLVQLGLDGWLQRADVLKLYELAYFAEGDVLEFGTYRGLSTYLLAKAIESSGRRARVVTMELDGSAVAMAKVNLADRGVASFVDFRVGDADAICRGLSEDGHRFSLAFVDHSHAYEPMVQACRRLEELLASGAFCLFHDFNDPRNALHSGVGESETTYGVYAAVADALDRARFEFWGVFGCCGLYRRVGG